MNEEIFNMSKTYFSIIDRISKAAAISSKLNNYPRLVAVSKTKPVTQIIELYNYGHRVFGENYVNELIEKAEHPLIREHCPDIKWHFIGHLQSNKINKIIDLPNLDTIETVHNEKLATSINNALMKSNLTNKLKIMVQVNTSREENKNGCEIEECTQLVSHILTNCSNLEFCGLMTIGSLENPTSVCPNPDFLNLVKCREELKEKLKLDDTNIELSMGMSADFEHAIELGSTNVRIGSILFGSR